MSISLEVTSIDNALSKIGISKTTLTEEEKKSLEKDGYLVIQSVFKDDTLEKIRSRFEKVMRKYGYNEGRIPVDNEEISMGDIIAKEFRPDNVLRKGQEEFRIAKNLVNEGEEFDQIYINPKLLASVYFCLNGEFHLSSLSACEAVKGEGLEKVRKESFVKCLIALDDFSDESGPLQIFIDGENPKYVEIPAGSICIINKNIKHASTQNQSNYNRRFLIVNFVSRDVKQELNQLEFLRRSTYLRLNEAAKYIMNV